MTSRAAPGVPMVFQPTLPARGATRFRFVHNYSIRFISTHAPRTGSDFRKQHFQWLNKNFNPRSPHGERQ